MLDCAVSLSAGNASMASRGNGHVRGVVIVSSTAIFPLLLLTTIAVRRKIVFQDALRLLPFFILALIAIPVNVWFQTHGGEPIRDLGLLERIQGAGMAVWFYLAKAWWPLDLLFVYPSWQIHADETSWWIPFIAVLDGHRRSRVQPKK